MEFRDKIGKTKVSRLNFSINFRNYIFKFWVLIPKLCGLIRLRQPKVTILIIIGIKELLKKEQIGFKELFSDYQPFYTINLLLNKEPLPIQEMPKLGIYSTRGCKNYQKKGTLEIIWTTFGILH